ncbi:helix-turn-helix domain-containing protein [Xanthocytophaga flava]|uniref:helix-turn-helix domain-containing protein n=1 Tax=Xanthocytophaga flava TaxID=3048013 RepID=UPI0028D143D0|nr:helix-turn-helix transcriptional regulator [Xanthocytophaga flavus]MDJ1466962.1 helix-turn-helix transcriptional regulator [Xanthocytophaga flavus]
MKTPGEILDEIVEALGINYVDLAKSIGVSRPDIFYNVRAGRAKPSYETLQSIANAYPQIDCRFLLTGQGKPLVKTIEAPKDEFKEYIKRILKEINEEN